MIIKEKMMILLVLIILNKYNKLYNVPRYFNENEKIMQKNLINKTVVIARLSNCMNLKSIQMFLEKVINEY